VALAARGALGSGVAPGALGVGARVAFGLPRGASVGVALAGERAVGSDSAYALTTGRLGASLGWGAPWGEASWVGASIEAGPAFGVLAAQSDVAPTGRSFLDGYAQASLIARAPASGALAALRPWVAVSILALTAPVHVTEREREVASLPRVSGGLDVGVAWAAW
jgi:hypothetical protein